MDDLLPELVPRNQVEGIITRRLEEKAVITKSEGIDRSLISIRRELTRLNKKVAAANHLKEEMVTKEEFKAFATEIRQSLGSVITVEQLDKDDFWVQYGVPHKLTQEEIDFAQEAIDKALFEEKTKKENEKWHDKIWVRVSIAAGVIGLAIVIWQTALMWYIYTHPICTIHTVCR